MSKQYGFVRDDDNDFVAHVLNIDTHIDYVPSDIYSLFTTDTGWGMSPINLPVEPLINSGTITKSILLEFNTFMENRDKYIEYDIPHKRGILLYGPAGTGKTCIARLVMREIAKLNGLAFVIDDARGLKLFQHAYEYLRKGNAERPICILFEDIENYDSSFVERHFLTNFLDGNIYLNNILFIATTNHFDSMHPSLKRPSRFDSLIEVGPADTITRKRYFESLIRNGEDIKNYEIYSDGMSFAEMKEFFICTRILNIPIETAMQRLGYDLKVPVVVDDIFKKLAQ